MWWQTYWIFQNYAQGRCKVSNLGGARLYRDLVKIKFDGKFLGLSLKTWGAHATCAPPVPSPLMQCLWMMHILWSISTALDFCCCLTTGARWAANCCSNITHGASFNSILFTSLSTQQEQGNAWHNQITKAAKYSRLVQSLSIWVDLARAAECSTQACFTVIHTSTKTLFPFSRHD